MSDSIRAKLIEIDTRRSPEMTAAVEQLQANGTLSPDAHTSQRGSPTPAAVPESSQLVAPSTYPEETSPAGNTLVLHVGDAALFAAGFALGLAASLIVCGICVGVAS